MAKRYAFYDSARDPIAAQFSSSPNRYLAQQLIAGGSKGRPLSAAEGLVKGGSSLLGALLMRDSLKKENKDREGYRESLARALEAGSPSEAQEIALGNRYLAQQLAPDMLAGRFQQSDLQRKRSNLLEAGIDPESPQGQKYMGVYVKPDQTTDYQNYQHAEQDPGFAAHLQSQNAPKPRFDIKLDQFGDPGRINQTSGEVTRMGQRGQTAAYRVDRRPGQRTGEGNVVQQVEQGTGPWAGMRALSNAVIGPVIEGTTFPETAEARAGLRNFAQEAKTALVNNPRFPVAEQKIVQELLPDPGRFWTDPDAERSKLLELRRFLQNKIQQNQQSMASGRVTQDELGRLSNQNEAINRVMGLMGSPDGEKQSALPEGVPQGSRRVGTLDGNPVYETPDGRRVVAE